ncbi:hypothetical protein [Gordonia sputi]|uniref:hypothetical protein n=1 Tax=Gordonia sputi TaxID=36823 RepID=UPI00367E1F24
MPRNGFGKYLPAEATEAAKRRHPSYRRGFGKHVDGSREAQQTKRSQLAEQRRARIRAAIADQSATYDLSGRPVDPLADDADAIEQAWADEYDNGGDAA